MKNQRKICVCFSKISNKFFLCYTNAIISLQEEVLQEECLQEELKNFGLEVAGQIWSIKSYKKNQQNSQNPFELY